MNDISNQPRLCSVWISVQSMRRGNEKSCAGIRSGIPKDLKSIGRGYTHVGRRPAPRTKCSAWSYLRLWFKDKYEDEMGDGTAGKGPIHIPLVIMNRRSYRMMTTWSRRSRLRDELQSKRRQIAGGIITTDKQFRTGDIKWEVAQTGARIIYYRGNNRRKWTKRIGSDFKAPNLFGQSWIYERLFNGELLDHEKFTVTKDVEAVTNCGWRNWSVVIVELGRRTKKKNTAVPDAEQYCPESHYPHIRTNSAAIYKKNCQSWPADQGVRNEA